jgi:microcystin-dependent protein
MVTFTRIEFLMNHAGNHGHNISWHGANSGGRSATHNHGVSAESPGTNAQGSGTGHANMQPWAAVNFIIKT